jgi:hypothetical protein
MTFWHPGRLSRHPIGSNAGARVGRCESMQRVCDTNRMTSNYTQERSVNHRGAQLLRTGIVAGRSGKR